MHLFSVALAAGQYAKVIVEQQGIDLVIGVFSPDGSPLIEFDSPGGLAGHEFVSMLAATSGEYRLKVRPNEEWAAAGSYKIRVEAIRTPTADDEKCFEAERVYAEGQRLSAREETRAAAIEKYKEAYKLWGEGASLPGEGGEPRHGQANALHSLGRTYRLLKDFKNAVEYYESAYQLRLKIGDRQGAAYTLNDMGTAYRELDSKQKALDYYQQALLLFRESGNRRGESGALHSIGFVHFQMGHMEEALKFYEQALLIRRAEQDTRGEANTLNAMAGVYDAWGDSSKVIELVGQAARGFQNVGDRARGAVMLNNVGKTYDDWGEWQKALGNYESALSIYRSLPVEEREKNLSAEASTLDNIGMTYAALGQTGRALEVLREALAIRERVKEPRGLGATKGVIGYIYFLQGDQKLALEFYHAALPCQEKAENVLKQSLTLTAIGMAYVSLGQGIETAQRTGQEPAAQKLVQDIKVQAAVCGGVGERLASLAGLQSPSATYRKALGYYEAALRLQSESLNRQGRAITLDKMGDVYTLLGDPQKGIESYKASLRLWQIVRDRTGEAITLHNLARLERDSDNLLEAHKRIAAALDIVESLRTNIISQQFRISYFASKQNFYELDIDVKMRLHKLYPAEGYDAAALRSSERARSRALLDMLAEADVDVREGVEPGLISREELLRHKLNEKAALQTQLLNGPHAQADADKLAKDITRLTDEHEDVLAQIKAQSPAYAALTRPQPLTLKEIQQQLLDDDTLLLEFALGSERSYVWVVSNHAVDSDELPKREVIEEAARKLYESLTAPQRLPDDDSTPQKRLERRERVAKAIAQYPSQAKYLSELLLGEVADKLGRKRLLIVADGVLQYIPFAALPSPALPKPNATRARAAASSVAGGAIPLIVEHEIIALPSASTLATLRSGTEKRRSVPGAVAVLADPVFDEEDGRALAARNRLPKHAQTASVRRLASAPDGKLSRSGFILRRLPQTAQEAEAIKNAAFPQDVMIAVGLEASRKTIMSPQLRQYRIIHLATHGVLDNVHPELSGIALSQVDEQGREQDGMLRLHDIYNLKLPAELAVLSACDTGLGKIIKGEGLVGLTRGFMYAGSPRVVATLWKVDDYATSLLMERFYQRMFQMKLSPAAALRQSQIEMMGRARWHEPFYWAAFVLHGEPGNIR